MSKPREFYVNLDTARPHAGDIGYTCWEAPLSDGSNEIRVIEYSAYEALQAENTKLLDKLANKHVTIHKENQALQAKLDKAVEALECCANDDRGHQSVAFEALQEITADQNKSGET